MIAATALLLPPVKSATEFGFCFTFPSGWLTPVKEIMLNFILISVAVASAFFLNKKFSFVKGAEGVLPVSMIILLASNPVNTSALGAPVIMLLVNLVCLDILMRSYCSTNATTGMFAIATYLSLGSMVEYGFVPLVFAYPVMGLMTKAVRLNEMLAYLLGLIAPYWVALGFGIVTFSDFRLPEFLTPLPGEDSGYLLFVYISLGLMALVGLMMTLNNAMHLYSGNLRVRTFNNIINLLGAVCAVCMLADFRNFEAYTPSFCFAASVQISNFFAMRHIPRSRVWFWCLLSVFIILFILMVVETTLH